MAALGYAGVALGMLLVGGLGMLLARRRPIDLGTVSPQWRKDQRREGGRVKDRE